MAIQHSVAVRNARCDAWETAIGTAPKFQLWTGSLPASCAAAATGTKLLETAFPSDWMSAASAGVKTLLGGTLAGTGIAVGSAGYYRIVDTAGTTCHEQGTVATSGGDMTIDNPSIVIGQSVNLGTFQKTEPGA